MHYRRTFGSVDLRAFLPRPTPDRPADFHLRPAPPRPADFHPGKYVFFSVSWNGLDVPFRKYIISHGLKTLRGGSETLTEWKSESGLTNRLTSVGSTDDYTSTNKKWVNFPGCSSSEMNVLYAFSHLQ